MSLPTVPLDVKLGPVVLGHRYAAWDTRLAIVINSIYYLYVPVSSKSQKDCADVKYVVTCVGCCQIMPVIKHFGLNQGGKENPRPAKIHILSSLLSDLNNFTSHETLSETRFRRGLESTIATSDAE